MESITDNFNTDKVKEYMENLKRINHENFPIYHYTSLDAMMKIIETKSLWATNCQYLNDILETKYILNIFDGIMYDAHKLLNAKQVEISKRIRDIFYDSYKNDLKNIFIISFSKEKDSVSMWQNYGKNGVIIEFSTPAFIRSKTVNKINILYKGEFKNIEVNKLYSYVIYDNNLIKDLLFFKSKNGDNNINLFLSLFIFKDKTYSYEKEIRIIFSVNDDIHEVEKYRIKNNLIVPYIDISFEENDKLPLKSIIYNPEQNDIMYEESIKRFLKSNGYDIPVIPSKSKIR